MNKDCKVLILRALITTNIFQHALLLEQINH